MATFSNNDVQRLLISQGGVSYSDNTTIDDLNDGEVAAYSPSGLKIIEDGNTPDSNEVNAGDVDRFYLVQGRGSGEPPIMSDVIDLRSVKETRIKTGESPSEQIDYIGYNGTSGSIDAINDNLYTIRLQMRQHITSNHGGIYTKHGVYESDSSATQEEVALGLARSLHFNQEREARDMYKAGAVNSAAVTSSNDLDEDLVITKGSHKAFISDAGNQNATTEYGGATKGTDDGNAYISAGDYIRIAGDTNSVATTDHTYKVEQVEYDSGVGATITLDREITEDSQTITGNDGLGTEVIPSGSIGSDWGVRIEGLARKHDPAKFPFDPINQVRWDLALENFGSTDETRDQRASMGYGSYKEVADLEWYIQGNEGEFYRTGEPNIYSPRKVANSADGPYDLVHIVHSQSERVNFQDEVSRKVTTWAVPNSTPDHADYSAGQDRLSDVLEDLVGAGATKINDTVRSSETFSDID